MRTVSCKTTFFMAFMSVPDVVCCGTGFMRSRNVLFGVAEKAL